MKKVLFAILSMTMLISTYGQEIKTDEKDLTSIKEAITKDSPDTMTLVSDRIIIENKLELEADSAQFDIDKNIITAFGTRTFTFKGKVIASRNDGTYKFYLDDDSQSILIIED